MIMAVEAETAIRAFMKFRRPCSKSASNIRSKSLCGTPFLISRSFFVLKSTGLIFIALSPFCPRRHLLPPSHVEKTARTRQSPSHRG
ncbi:MAG: hypothetical protein A2V65_01615 [Deltaproteobacteria bacterium RBG_13_49_15]|nr:MAG: hypothetical protein A2V65_01615 [Deltaproteobacteria bacterium RBG_13_49_15]